MRTFADLIKLADQQPSTYFREVEKMQVQDPERFAQFVEHVRKGMSELSCETRPMTSIEINELVAHTASALGWSKTRVLAEAVLRLRADLLESNIQKFIPVTPSEPSVIAKRLRRHSSIQALVLGDAKALKAKHHA